MKSSKFYMRKDTIQALQDGSVNKRGCVMPELYLIQDEALTDELLSYGGEPLLQVHIELPEIN